MRRLTLAIVVVCGLHVAISLALAAHKPEAQAPPELSLPKPMVLQDAPCDLTSPEPIFEAGRLKQGAEIEHVFTITNSGPETLRLDRAQSDCGCTVAELKKKELASGESTEVHITFKAGALVGSFNKTVRIFVEPEGSLVLSVRGRVQPDFIADPPALDFGEVRIGQQARRTVRLLPAREGASWAYGEPYTLDPDVKPTSDGKGQVELVLEGKRKGPKMGAMTLPGKVPLYVRYIGQVVP